MSNLRLKLLAWMRSEFWKRIGFAGNGIWKLELSEGVLESCQAVEEDASAFPILLVGRSLCFEQEKHIPVDSWLEARSIAHQIPVSAPFDGVRKVSLSVGSSGGFHALITVIDVVAIETAMGSLPWALIPISWLAPALASQASAQIDLPGESVGFIFRQSRNVSMLLTTKDQQRDFWWAVGQDPSNVNVVTQDQSLQFILPGLGRLSSTQWLESFRGHRANSLFDLSDFDWVSAGKLASIFAASYLVIVSIFLAGFSVVAELRASSEPPEFLEVLSARRESNQLSGLEEQWESLKADQFPVWVIWPVMEDVAEHNALVRSIEFDGGTVEVSYLAKDATEILNTIIASPYASNVEFGTATRQDRRTRLDQFSVRWTVSDEGPKESVVPDDD